MTLGSLFMGWYYDLDFKEDELHPAPVVWDTTDDRVHGVAQEDLGDLENPEIILV